MPQDIVFLRTALRLAKKGLGRTFPNPMVGAVLVKGGKVIGQGYHHRAGRPHAEIEAMRSAVEPVRGATLYVNLEPCGHYGRTPPCVDAIVKAGITRVVCCTPDPNPKVFGRSIRRLRNVGIKVSVGGLVEEAQSLNEAFFVFHRRHRPYIAIKFAASLDGKIATRKHDSRWITNEEARIYARSLRRQYQAVLVGINTIFHDNPHLGVRAAGKTDPLRIIFDSTLRIPLTSRVLRDKNVLIITTQHASRTKYEHLTRRGVPLVVCPGGVIRLRKVMAELVKREIIGVFVEGGGSVLGSFVDAGFVDKVYAFYAPVLIGGKNAVSAVGGEGASTLRRSLRLTNVHHRTFGDNILVTASATSRKSERIKS